MGKVESINISKQKGTIKESVSSAMLIEDFGIENDAHAGKWHRQVSLLAKESIEIMKNQGATGLCSGKFAENITTEGLELHTLPVGSKLKIGDVLLEITQIGKECHHGCEILKQVGSCIMPKHGIFTKVLVGGEIKANDDIEVIRSEV